MWRVVPKLSTRGQHPPLFLLMRNSSGIKKVDKGIATVLKRPLKPFSPQRSYWRWEFSYSESKENVPVLFLSGFFSVPESLIWDGDGCKSFFFIDINPLSHSCLIRFILLIILTLLRLSLFAWMKLWPYDPPRRAPLLQFNPLVFVVTWSHYRRLTTSQATHGRFMSWGFRGWRYFRSSLIWLASDFLMAIKRKVWNVVQTHKYTPNFHF